MNRDNEIMYKTAEPWRVILWPISAGVSNMYMMLMMFSSYIAAGGYGIAIATAGIIITGTRIFDAVTDPIIAFVGDRFQSKYGRVRIMMTVGYTCIVLSILMMFFWGIGQGLVVFTLSYILYIIGRTIFAVARDMGTPIITNEPKQRIAYGRWSVIYTQVFVVAVSSYLSLILAPKYNGLSVAAFQEMALVSIAAGTVLILISMIVISPYDKMENFHTDSSKKISTKDMWQLIKGNRQLWAFIAAATSDKLALQAASQSAITTLVFGVIIGNYSFNGNLSLIALVPTILMVFYATKLRGKSDTRSTLVKWTWIAIGISLIMLTFLLIIDPKKISVTPIYTIAFIILFCLRSGATVVTSACNNAMIPDLVDYEFYRSGNYLAGTIAAIASFIDKLVSSFASTIVGFSLAAVGFATVMPQPGDEVTAAIFGITMFLWLGLPIIGWITTQIAMRFYILDGPKMKEIQYANNIVKADKISV